MSSRKALAAVALALAAATPAAAGEPPAAFQPARPGYRFAFPRDHAAHPAFKTEWWYYTGNLRAGDGRAFGYQLTFFRVGVPRGTPLGKAASRWRAGDVHLAHFALSDVANQAFAFDERLQRGDVGLAWARADRYEVVNGTWGARLDGQTHRLTARSGDRAITLALTPAKPPVVHGHDGVSQKSACPTCASHYYSLTRMRTAGTLTVGGQKIPVEGLSWMDHEFGSNQLGSDEAGWDWFSAQLDDGSELMLYQLRQTSGLPVPESSGTFVRPDGGARHLPLDAFGVEPAGYWTSPASKGRYPMGWTVTVQGERLKLTITPAFEGQELRAQASVGETYWEGAVTITGTRAGRPVKGAGYVEMTGYAGRFKAPI